MPLLPSVLWAQRADHLILTIDLQEAKSPNVKVDSSGTASSVQPCVSQMIKAGSTDNCSAGGSGTVHYRGQAKSHATGAEFHDYELQLELYAEVESNDSQVSVTDRRVLLKVAKTKEEYWPRLLKSAGKVPNVKVDWSKWVDEDEEESKPQYDMGDLQNLSNFDLGAAGASGGGLGADALGGADEDDSDDEDLPDLESSS